MTKIEELKKEMEARLPGVKASLEAPPNPRGSHFLDLSLGHHKVVVEWSPLEEGFGVTSLPSDHFGSGADEVYDDVASTSKRLVEVLKEGRPTHAPRELLLHELRDKLGMTQEDLAKAVNVRQSTLSKMERRRDVLITTEKIMGRLGGKLEISARFPGPVQPSSSRKKCARPQGRTPKRSE
jgi:DNA-binding XRE family transcriptional regulator